MRKWLNWPHGCIDLLHCIQLVVHRNHKQQIPRRFVEPVWLLWTVVLCSASEVPKSTLSGPHCVHQEMTNLLLLLNEIQLWSNSSVLQILSPDWRQYRWHVENALQVAWCYCLDHKPDQRQGTVDVLELSRNMKRWLHRRRSGSLDGIWHNLQPPVYRWTWPWIECDKQSVNKRLYPLPLINTFSEPNTLINIDGVNEGVDWQ